MQVKFSPEGGAVQEWSYKPAKVRLSRAELIEKHSGMSFDEFGRALLAGRARARRVLLWHCLATDHPTYRWEDTPDFAMSEFELAFDAEELAVMRERVASTDVDGPAKERALAVIDKQIAEAASDPKASLSNSDPDTGAS